MAARRGRVDWRNLLRKRAVRLGLILLILVPLMYVAADLATASAVRWKSNVQGDLTLKVNPTNRTDSWDFTAIRFNITQFEVQGGPVDIRLVETDNGITVRSYDGVSNTTLDGIVYPDVAAAFALPGKYFSISVNGSGTTATVSFHIETYIAEDVTPGPKPSLLWNYVSVIGNTVTLVFIVTISVEFIHTHRNGLAADGVTGIPSPLIPCIFLAVVATLSPVLVTINKLDPYFVRIYALTWGWVQGTFVSGPIFSTSLLIVYELFFPLSFVLVTIIAVLYGFFFLQFIRYYYKETSLIRVLTPLVVSDLIILACGAPLWYYSFFEYRYSPGHQPLIPPDPFGTGPLVLLLPTFVLLVTAWLVCLYIRKRGYMHKTMTTVKVDNTDLTVTDHKSQDNS